MSAPAVPTATAEELMGAIATPREFLRHRLNAQLAGVPVRPAAEAWAQKLQLERGLLDLGEAPHTPNSSHSSEED